MNRYKKHIILSEIGQVGQEKLSAAKVLVIGAGGLGCPVLQYLTAAGVGSLGIVDFDVVEESNLQRQVLFGSSTLGINKAVAAKNRLSDLNNTIQIDAYPERLTASNALPLFSNYDIIVDCTDNFASRYLINDASILTKKPLVYGAIYKFEGQVSVFNYKEGPTYRCLFPEPPSGLQLSCDDIGVLGVLPGIIGALQANEVLKIILNIGNALSGKLLCYNALTSETNLISLTKTNASESQTEQSFKADFEENNVLNCSMEISIEAALNMKEVHFIDVREYGEGPLLTLPNLSQIPLNELARKTSAIDKNTPTIFLCQSGKRSRLAVLQLQKKGFQNCFSLKGGAHKIVEHYKQLVHE